MNVIQAIHERRAYRSLKPIKITDELINDFAKSAQLAPSCFNNQPWRFVFVYESEMLKRLHSALSRVNVWGQSASLIIAVFSRKEYDCRLKNRDYYLFDTGIATGFLILRATELGLVAHPIAGFDEEKVKDILGIPDDYTVITLVIVGELSETISPILSEGQVQKERMRPERISFEEFVYFNSFKGKT